MSRITNTQTTPRNGSPITFGVEIEAVLAFHQDELQAVLDTYYANAGSAKPRIIKNIPDRAHFDFLDNHPSTAPYSCRTLHPSWALQANGTPDDDKSLLVSDYTTLGGKEKIRPYFAEVLLIAQNLLQQSYCPTDVKAFIHGSTTELAMGDDEPSNTVALRAKKTNTGNWTLTLDNTVIGALACQLEEALGTRIYNSKTKSLQARIASSLAGLLDTLHIYHPSSMLARLSDVIRAEEAQRRIWDSAGIELISPILHFNKREEEFAKVGRYVSALGVPDEKTQACALTSTWAGLHVHIGLNVDKNDSTLLLVLQHLAYLLVCHEDLITKLHPRSRCGLAAVASQDRPARTHQPVAGGHLDPDRAWEQYAAHNAATVLDAESTNTSFGQVLSNKRFFLHRRRISPTLEHTDAPLFLQKVHDKIFGADIKQISNLVSGLQKRNSSQSGSPSNDSASSSGPRSSSASSPPKTYRGGARATARRIDFYRGYMYNFSNIYNYCHSFGGGDQTLSLPTNSGTSPEQDEERRQAQSEEGCWKQAKPTVEFRQHASTTTTEEVTNWIDFCRAIVACAERNAYTSLASQAGTAPKPVAGSYNSNSQTISGVNNSSNANDVVANDTTAATNNDNNNKLAAAANDKTQQHGVSSSSCPTAAMMTPANSIESFCGPAYLDLNAAQCAFWKGRFDRYNDDGRPSGIEIDDSEESRRLEYEA